MRCDGGRALRGLGLWVALALAGCAAGDPAARLAAIQEEAIALATTLADRPAEAGQALADLVDGHARELAAIRADLVALQEADPGRGDRVMSGVVERRDQLFVRWSELVRQHPALGHEPRAMRAMRRLLQ